MIICCKSNKMYIPRLTETKAMNDKKIKRLESNLREEQTQSESLLASEQSLKARLNKMKNEMTFLKQEKLELDELRKKESQNQQTVTNLKKKLDLEENTTEETRVQLEKKKKEVENLQKTVVSLEKEVEDYRNSEAGIEGTLKDYDAQKQLLRQEIRVLEEENDRLRNLINN
eukprot:m.67689 g.67689  ORF g.67689 m.67689 type:complete len:172 (-) comp11908_c0_seq1:46-561(-)